MQQHKTIFSKHLPTNSTEATARSQSKLYAAVRIAAVYSDEEFQVAPNYRITNGSELEAS